jgi:hypothetical protein
VSFLFYLQGTSTIVDVVADSTNPGIFYASTLRGEILVFEAQNKADAIDCRLKGRLSLQEAEKE